MALLDQNGALKMRFIPLIVGIPAVGGISYGAALTVGPAIGLLFLCFVVAVTFVGLAAVNDRVQKLEEQIKRRREDAEPDSGARLHAGRSIIIDPPSHESDLNPRV